MIRSYRDRLLTRDGLAAIGQSEAKEKLSLKAAGERMSEQLAKVPAFAGTQTVAGEPLAHLTR